MHNSYTTRTKLHPTQRIAKEILSNLIGTTAAYKPHETRRPGRRSLKGLKIIRWINWGKRRRAALRIRVRINWTDIARAQLHIYLPRSNIARTDPKVRSSRLGADVISRRRGIGCLRTNVPAWRTSECACAQLRFTRGTPTGNYARIVTYEGEKKIARANKGVREGEREGGVGKKERSHSDRTRKRDTSPRRRDDSVLSRLFVNGWETAVDFPRLLSSPYVPRTRVKRGSETSPRGKPRRHRSPPRSLTPFLSSRRDGGCSPCAWIAGTNRRGKIKNRRVFAADAAPRRAKSRASRGQVIRCIISSLRMQHHDTSGRERSTALAWDENIEHEALSDSAWLAGRNQGFLSTREDVNPLQPRDVEAARLGRF